MNKRLLTELAVAVLLLIAVTGIIAVTDADLNLSAQFYRDGRWPVGEQFPWKLLYRIDRTPALILALCGMTAAVWGCFSRPMRRWVSPGSFLVLLLVLGPGLTVNVIFKDHWGRPRPREVQQFGGARQFQQPWQLGVAGAGRSFPSGHSSAAFYLSAPYFIYRRSRPRLATTWLLGGALFGVAMSYARIVQGGHFLSDTVWAFGMVWITALLLSGLLLKKDDRGVLEEQS